MRGKISQIWYDQVTQLFVLLSQWSSPNGKHKLDVGVVKAFAKNTLADHSGGTEQDDFHKCQIDAHRSPFDTQA